MSFSRSFSACKTAEEQQGHLDPAAKCESWPSPIFSKSGAISNPNWQAEYHEAEI